MTHTTTTTRRAAFTVIAVATAVVFAGCGTTTEQSVPDGGTPPTSTGAPVPTVCTDRIDPNTGTDTCDLDAVLAGAADALYSYRPAEQTQKGVNIDSAATLLNPAWVRQLGVSYSALAPVTGADWDRWAATGLAVDAEANVTPDDHPADTIALARRVVAVHQSVVDSGGAEVDELAPIVLYMTATRANALAGWSVSGITVR
ncbi:hypothetical protein [Rhodococcus sp. NBC_00294]|uniref:hypothetical protein n=1 Tax=Rhodococcus sp. NBC_00294 TaxID=2976004 RepID=UPI002E28D433|nr:hypothetical protein [Rhodococcus sp. NBC_00294]